MVTNTAFYRNENYHHPTDTMETLDIDRMTSVIDAIFQALLEVGKEPRQSAPKKFQSKTA